MGLLLGIKLYYDVSGGLQMEPAILNLLRNEVEGGQVAATVPATVVPPVAAVSKQPMPQNEAEIRQWLAAFENGSLIADKLINEELVGAKDLEMLSNLRPTELKTLLEFSVKQALTLEAALKELF